MELRITPPGFESKAEAAKMLLMKTIMIAFLFLSPQAHAFDAKSCTGNKTKALLRQIEVIQGERERAHILLDAGKAGRCKEAGYAEECKKTVLQHAENTHGLQRKLRAQLNARKAPKTCNSELEAYSAHTEKELRDLYEKLEGLCH